MQNRNMVVNISVIATAVVLIVLAAFTVFNAGNVIRMWAIDSCYQASISEVKNTDASSWKGPNKDIFQACIKLKDLNE